MTIPFALFDFLAYLFPGMTVLLLIFLTTYLNTNIVQGIVADTILIALSYLIGHVVQNLGQTILYSLRHLRPIKPWLMSPKSQLLRRRSEVEYKGFLHSGLFKGWAVTPYSEPLADRIVTSVQDYYELEDIAPTEYFSLCFSAVRENTGNWPILNSLATMGRGMVFVSAISFVVFLLGAFGVLELVFFASSQPVLSLGQTESTVLAGLSIIALYSFFDQYRHFQVFAVNAIYQSWLAFYTEKTREKVGEGDA
jgi:hypothetical protein